MRCAKSFIWIQKTNGTLKQETAVVAVNLGLKAENVHVVFNNNRSNDAPKSAEQMQRILRFITRSNVAVR